MSSDIDLIKLFGVEGLVSNYNLAKDSKEKVKLKSPGQMSDEISILLKDIEGKITTCDKNIDSLDACINSVLESIDGVLIRANCMKDVALDIKKTIDKGKKK